MVSRFYESLGRIVVKWRWVVVAVWFIAVAVASTLPQMATESSAQSSSFLPASAPSEQAAAMLAPLLGNTNTSQLEAVASSSTGPLSAGDLQQVNAVLSKVTTVPHITGAKVVAVAPSRTAAQIVVTTNLPFFQQSELATTFTAFKAALVATPLRHGLAVYPSGQTADNLEGGGKTKSQNGTIELFSLVFILGLLFLIFRSLLAPILIVIPAVLSSQIAGGIIGELGAHGLKISAIAVFLLTVLVLGAGVDYGLFLVFRVREEVEKGAANRPAVVEAVHKVGESITASAGTVIVALITVLSATFGIYHDLAIPLAIGIGVMLLAGLTLQPALVAIFGRAAFWPTKLVAKNHVDGVWGRTAGRLLKRPLLTLVAGVLVLGVLAAFVVADKPSGFGGSTSAPAGTVTAAGDRIVAAEFPKTSGASTSVVYELSTSLWEQPALAASLETKLLATGQFAHVSGPFDATGEPVSPSVIASFRTACGPAKDLTVETAAAHSPACAALIAQNHAGFAAYFASSRFLSADGHLIAFSVTLTAGDGLSTSALNAVPAVRSAVATVGHDLGATKSGVYGIAAILNDVSTLSNNDLHTMVPLAALAIGLILALVLRSLIAPLYLIASVVLSYLASLGFAVIVFMEIGGQSGLIYFLPFMLFLFLLALGEDYNILVMTRIREEAKTLPLKQAVIRAIGTTGTTVTSAGLVLAGTFVVFGIVIGASGGSGSSAFNAVAYGLAAGILMDTFVVRTVLVPSVVVLLGRWNWWPSKVAASTLVHDEVVQGGAN